MFEIASIIGSIAFALSGFMLGVRKELDAMGLFIMAMLTANGGGALRDVLVGKIPGVLTDPFSFYLVLGTFIAAILFKLNHYTRIERRWFFVVSDSIGLVAFSFTGALVALEYDLNIFGVILLAFLTATGGGMIRDILLNEVPALLSSGFYGSVAIIIALIIFALDSVGLLNNTSLTVLFVLGLTLRLVAHAKDWHLPRIIKNSE